MCLWFELPTASGPKSARVYCGYRPGPARVTLPSKQDDENVRAPALSRTVCAVVLVSDVCGGGRFTVTVACLPAKMEKSLRTKVKEKIGNSLRKMFKKASFSKKSYKKNVISGFVI